MDIPVRYTLREPFFISSRLMPAVRVWDATIHIQAHSVDAEDGDTIVRWEYLIDAPSLHYAAFDVSTPYLGQDAIADQLPTAMGTLLDGLSHLADGDEAGPIPHEVYVWAHRHRDDITIMADDMANPEELEMSSAELLRAITHDPYQTRYGRWCAGQAVAHADRLAILNPHPAPATNTGLAVRDDAWHDTALGWYTMLTNRPEPEQPTILACTVADRATIENWLRRSTYGFTDRPGNDPAALQALVEHAQQAGLFGIRNHTIGAHTVVDYATGSDATLLTIHTPSGATLAAGPLAIDALTSGVTGPGDAVTVLRNCATAVDRAYPASPDPVASDRSRAFPPLVSQLAATPTSSPPGNPDAAAHRHR